MKSILSLIDTIQRNQFRGNYLKNKKLFSEIIFPVLKSILNFENFQKKDNPHSRCMKNEIKSILFLIETI